MIFKWMDEEGAEGRLTIGRKDVDELLPHLAPEALGKDAAVVSVRVSSDFDWVHVSIDPEQAKGLREKLRMV